MVRDPPHGLAVFDLDGTLLRGLTVCEVLAGPLGHLERMQQFEALLHASALDIAAAREEMAGWYRAVPLADLTALLETATVAPGAAEAIALFRQHGIAVAIASITWEFAVAWFAQRLRIDYYVGTRLAVDGAVSHFWPHEKATWARTLGERLHVPLHRIAGIGDSAGDVEMLRAVGTPIFVGQTLPLTLQGVTHFPNADMRTIAHWLIARWQQSVSPVL
jgi:HAD superfamily phosphoserine phosphatase-like hydrolase